MMWETIFAGTQRKSKSLREASREEAIILHAHHLLKMQSNLIKELCEGADEDYLESIEAEGINVQVQKFLEDNPIPKFS